MSSASSEDRYLAHLIEARESPSVLKLQLARVRADLPNMAIFVFEGDDDKIIYYQWIRRVSEDLRYEPFVCGGKREVRKLKGVLARDLNNLKEDVYFFVDRDFDDVEGFPDDNGLLMTDRYSVESYLVESVVLEECLKAEFPCHGSPEIRLEIARLFNAAYESFLEVTKDVNRRLFYARRLGIELVSRLPERIGPLADVGLDRVLPSGQAASALVVLAREPSQNEQDELAKEFEKLDPKYRYRGKFAYVFFTRWLTLLVEECSKPRLGLFGGIESVARPRAGELTMGSFASRSPLPVGMAEFIRAI